MERINMNRPKFTSIVALIIIITTIGMLTVILLTMALDQSAYNRANTYRGEDGLIPRAIWDVYLTQAVEAYIYGSALGIILTLGLLSIVIIWYIGPSENKP